MKLNLIMLCFLLSIGILKAQENEHLVGSSGGSANSSSYQLTFGFGEPVVMSSYSDNYRLALGYIGKDLVDIITNNKDELLLSTNVFPNPFRESFQLKLNSNANYEVSIYDINGQLKQNQKTQGQESITLYPDLINGYYFLEIINTNTFERTFTKIIKL